MAVNQIEVSLGFPFGIGSISGTWSPNKKEKVAAWAMYVELVTRVAIVELKEEEGLIREAFNSLYSLFPTTRLILKDRGPDVAIDGQVNFGHLAVSVLNFAIRPMLAKWHPLLDHHESLRPADQSPLAWEKSWEFVSECRGDLTELQESLRSYAGLLGEICGSKELLSLTEKT